MIGLDAIALDWRAHRRKLAVIGAAGACAVAAVALLPDDVRWSDAQAASGAAAPMLAVDLAAIADTAVTIGGRTVVPVAAETAHGIVKSGEEAVIASRMTALITALPLDAGQGFRRGQLLARFDCSQVRAQLAAANAAAAAYRKTYDTNVELDQYKAIGTNEVGVAKANLGKAVAEAQAVQAATGQCAIFAPFAGTVVERIAHPHDVAAAGQPLLKIQGAGDLAVELIVPSKWLTWLKPGTPFSFALDETGGTVQGRIDRLGAAVDPVSKTMRVTGSITVTGTVVPGMSGTASFAGTMMAALHDLTRPPAAARSPLVALLAWEQALRAQESVAELRFFIANETRELIAHDQAFVLVRLLAGDGWRIETASSLAAVDRNAPVIRAIEAAVADASGAAEIDAPDDDALAEYPYRHWLWQPLVDRSGDAFGGILLARAHPFGETEADRLARLADTAQHGWLALTGGRPVRRLPRPTARQRRILWASLAGTLLFPVRMSALAPVEVVAADPYVVTAPFAGVVESIAVAPSAQVTKGQPLLAFDAVKLRNELSLAAERLTVARAKVDEVSSASFGDGLQARGITIAQAEYRLADAEYRYARDMLARARVVAPFAGTAIYTDRREWEGRAVEVGQPIMQVADPARVRYRIDLPAREQLKLAPGSAVSVWLDSQPLWSQSATLVDASYQARPTADGTLAFALDAAPSDGGTPRIGSRGTARVRGRWAPLGYAILKRPIASVRQSLGI